MSDKKRLSETGLATFVKWNDGEPTWHPLFLTPEGHPAAEREDGAIYRVTGVNAIGLRYPMERRDDLVVPPGSGV